MIDVIKKLTKFGSLEVFSENRDTLTVFIKGSRLSENRNVSNIQEALILDDYPYLLVCKNDDDYFLAVLGK